jgi:lipopolysaccharide/colanic/teichoic acid biosynthesis glycosyltransferase
VGKTGQEFTYYKFRSMRHNNDNLAHYNFIVNYVRQATAPDNEKLLFKLTDDKRITPVGRIIRKLSLDEVPQLINVIRGEMAIVGPRPPVPYEYSLYDDWCKGRLAVLPGITGLAQIRARGQATFRQMVELDLEYIARRNLLLDWQIMLETPLVMLKGV